MKLMIALVAVMVLNVSAIYAENQEPENYLRRSIVKPSTTVPAVKPTAVADSTVGNPTENRNPTNAHLFRRRGFWGGCGYGWDNCNVGCGWNNCNVGWGGWNNSFYSRTVLIQQTPVCYPQNYYSTSTFIAGGGGAYVDPYAYNGVGFNGGFGVGNGAFAPGPFAGPGNWNGGYNVPGLRGF